MKKKLMIAAAGVVLGMQALRWSRRIGFMGRVVVITGGSRGLGLILARQLAKQGAKLVLLARDEAELEQARRDVEAHGAEVLTVPCDVRDQQDTQSAIDLVVEQFGQIDVLINDAGIIQVGPMEHMQLADYKDAMDVHFWGSLHTILAAVPHMKRAGFGRILNITSIGGKVAFPHMAPYAASKFAQVGLSGSLRAELAKDGILVTAICPGPMRTGSHLNAFFKGQHEKEFRNFAALGGGPWGSLNADSAARQIIEACRHGDAELTLPAPHRVLATLHGLMPGMVAEAFSLLARIMPGPTSDQGDELKSGWESRSTEVPANLTRLADQATEENNGLRGHEVATSQAVGEQNGHL